MLSRCLSRMVGPASDPVAFLVLYVETSYEQEYESFSQELSGTICVLCAYLAIQNQKSNHTYQQYKLLSVVDTTRN